MQVISASNSFSGPVVIGGGTLKLASGSVANIVNPSFETPVLGAGGYQSNPTGAGWTFTGSVGIAANGSSWYSPNAPDGTQAAFVQSASVAITQNIAFPAAGTYTLGFFAVTRSGYVADTIQVQIDSAPICTFASSSSTAWTPYAATFSVASAGSHTLTFLGQSVGSTCLDNVAVTNGPPVSTDALPDTSPLSLTSSGAVLDINGNIETIGPLGGVAGSQILTGGGMLTVNGLVSSTFSGAISGSGSLGKSGSGVLTLLGNNVYSGGTSLSGGTLLVGGGGQLGSGAYAGNVADNATLAFASNTLQTLSGTISGSGSLTVLGPGALALSGSNTYSGPTVVSGGTLQIGNGGSAGSLAASSSISVAGGTTLVFSRSDSSYTIANAIAGGGAVVFGGVNSSAKTTASSFGLSGANSGFTGLLTVNHARVNVAAPAQLGSGPVDVRRTGRSCSTMP